MRHSLVLILDPIDEVVEYARLPEGAGFEAVWLTDFYNRDAFVRMAIDAQATERIGIASGIACLSRSPLPERRTSAVRSEALGGQGRTAVAGG